MPIYEESNNFILNAKSHLKHVVNRASKPPETLTLNDEGLGDGPDPKAYVRTIESEYVGHEGSAVPSIGVSISQDANLLKGHEVPHIENIHLEDDASQILIHDRGSDPRGQLTANTAINNARFKNTVPQPFTLATDKRASDACKLISVTISDKDKKHANMNNKELPNLVKKTQASLSLESRKPLQPENSKYVNEDDVCSVTSLSAASVKAFKSRTTIASAPTFRVSERAEKWKEYYMKLEQKHQVLEAERIECETRKKEEEEAALKELRRSLKFKATPMPSFYQEGPPPKPELKKIPTTRAKSPRFARRKSCGDAHNSPSPADSSIRAHVHADRRSLDSAKLVGKSRSGISCKVEEESNQRALV